MKKRNGLPRCAVESGKPLKKTLLQLLLGVQNFKQMTPKHVSITLLAALAFLTGCVNPYRKFYTSFTNGQPVSLIPDFLPCEDGIQIFSTDDFVRDRRALQRHGFVPIGSSSFVGGAQHITEGNVREQAEEIGACRVLISSKYQNTVSGAIPWTTPNNTTSYTTGSAYAYGSGGYANAYGSAVTTTYGTQTTMIPYSVDRYEAGALYFAKRKFKIGLVYLPVPAEATQTIGQNGGVLVDVVIQGSPAYKADIIEGDVLWTINGNRVDPENWSSLIKGASRELNVELYRKGELIKKTLTLAE